MEEFSYCCRSAQNTHEKCLQRPRRQPQYPSSLSSGGQRRHDDGYYNEHMYIGRIPVHDYFFDSLLTNEEQLRDTGAAAAESSPSRSTQRRVLPTRRRLPGARPAGEVLIPRALQAALIGVSSELYVVL